MVARILVATPLEKLGELICQTLESAAGYEVACVGRSAAVLELCRKAAFDLIILDADLAEEEAFSNLGKAVVGLQPGATLLVLLDENTPRATPLKDLPVRAYLTRPFFIPVLLESVSSALTASTQGGRLRKDHPNPGGSAATFWDDPAALVSFLERWTMETPARGALIANENQILAASGGLPSPALADLTDVALRYARTQTTRDLVRFIQLPTIASQVLLYALRIPGEAGQIPESLVMGLVFDAGQTVSAARAQSVRTLKALITHLQEAVQPLSEPVWEGGVAVFETPDHPEPQGIDPEDSRPPAGDPDPGLVWEERPIPVGAPLVDMPQPEAAVEVNRSWIQETTGEPAPSLIRTGLLEEAPVLRLPIEEAPETFEADLGPLPAGFGQADWVVAEEIPDPEKPLATVDMPTETIALPDLSTTVHLADRLDPLSTEVYNLPFTCVLVPRFPGHYLIGDLAESLSMWYPQICLAYGWRLEGLSVRPEYIQWMVRIPPTTAPDVLLTILRQHTSQRIFEAFPRLRAENSSGEFWAPGYLILSGIQYASATLLADFIRHTRQRQGIGS